MLILNGSPIQPTIFPDKTSQVWKLDIQQDNVVEWHFENESEIFHLVQLKLLLDIKNTNCSLHIPYLPYARQDKEINNSATFAIHALAKILNSLNFNRILLYDPHSTRALELLQNSYNLYVNMVRPIIQDIIHTQRIDTICYPDKGAYDKYNSYYKDLPSVICEKIRCQDTGNILKLSVIGEYKNKNVLIIDDICDGGATFINIAKELRTDTKSFHLFITHGIFSKGLEILESTFDSVNYYRRQQC